MKYCGGGAVHGFASREYLTYSSAHSVFILPLELEMCFARHSSYYYYVFHIFQRLQSQWRSFVFQGDQCNTCVIFTRKQSAIIAKLFNQSDHYVIEDRQDHTIRNHNITRVVMCRLIQLIKKLITADSQLA